MANRVLLTKTLEHIRANPTTWVQNDWITADNSADPGCGTAYCFAGWAVVLSGYSIGADALITLDQLAPDLMHRLADEKAYIHRRAGVPQVAVHSLATILLDIPRWHGCDGRHHHLFCGGNSLDQLTTHVAALCSTTTGA